MAKSSLKWKLLLVGLGMFAGILIGARIRYRDAFDIALNVPWKVYCPWVDDLPLPCSDVDYNEKLFKALRIFSSGKGKYGIRMHRYEYDGTLGGMRWLMIKDGKAESGEYDYRQVSTPRPEKRSFVKWTGTAMRIGYFLRPPGGPGTQGYGPGKWVEDERGLAITNERYQIHFTAPMRRGGF